MSTETGAAAGKTFDFTYALTDAEIKAVAAIFQAKRVALTKFSKSMTWITVFSGLGFACLLGFIAKSYYELEFDYRVSALITGFFIAFCAGSLVAGWLIQAWHGRIAAIRKPSLQEPVHVLIDQDRIIYAQPDKTWQALWRAVEGITVSRGIAVLWIGPDQGIPIPLRAVLPPEDRAVLIDHLNAWIKATAPKS
jgi:hypothetical protein